MSDDKFTLDFVSDVHLEFRGKNLPVIEEPHSKYLALLGDIGKPRMGNYDRFIDSVCQQYEKVFVIAGNHEYYNAAHTHDNTLQFMKEYFIQKPSCEFLDNSCVVVDDVKLIGCTLWTHVDPGDISFISEHMNDYKKIKKAVWRKDNVIKKPITVFDTNDWNLMCKYYLEEELHDSAENSISNIVLTHHVPVGLPSVVPIQYRYEPYCRYNPAYYSNCADILNQYDISAWLFGHCHTQITSRVGKCQLMSNPMGYPGENQSSNVINVRTLVI